MFKLNAISLSLQTINAQLYPDEKILVVQDGVGLYDGKEKSPLHTNGRLHLTSHRLLYLDALAPHSSSLALPLALVRQTEFWAGFLKSSAKITLLLGEAGEAVRGATSEEEASGVREFEDEQAAGGERSWVCRVCGMRNVRGGVGGKCTLCGVARDPVGSAVPSRKGGEKPFYAALKTALVDKAWEGDSGAAKARRKEGVGIDAIMRGMDEEARSREGELDDAFKDLNALMAKAKEMITLARTMNERLSSQPSQLSGGETTLVRASLVNLGLPAEAVTPDMVRDEQQYHAELAKELKELLRRKDGVLKDGLAGLDEVWCVWNRARGVALVSPKDLQLTAPWLSTSAPRIFLRTFSKSGLTVLHTSRFTRSAFLARLLEQLDLRRALAESFTTAFDVERASAEREGITTLEVAQTEGVALNFAKEMLEELEMQSGDVVRDEQGGEGVRWLRTQQPDRIMANGRHQKGLASVGSASSLFGSSDEETDFFATAGGGPPPQQQHYQPQAQARQTSPVAYTSPSQNQGISTVMEEEEPPSPDLARRETDDASSTNFGGGDDGAHEHDWRQHDAGAQQEYAAQQGQYDQDDFVEPPYYPGFVYDRASNSYLPDSDTPQTDWSQQGNYDESQYQQQQQQDQQWDHAQQHAQQSQESWDSYPADGQAAHDSASSSYQPEPEFEEPPYYPGFIYDRASNSYLPDEYYEPEPEPAPEPEPQPAPTTFSPVIASPPPQAVAPPPAQQQVAPPPRSAPAPAPAASVTSPPPTSAAFSPPPRSGSSSGPTASQHSAGQRTPQATSPPVPASATFERTPQAYAPPPATASPYAPPPAAESHYSNPTSPYASPPPQNDPQHQEYNSLAADDDFDESGWDEAITTSADASHDDAAARRAAVDAASPTSPQYSSRPPWQQTQQQPLQRAGPQTPQQSYGFESLSLNSSSPSYSAPPPARTAPPATTPSRVPELSLSFASPELADHATLAPIDHDHEGLNAPVEEDGGGSGTDDDAWFGGGADPDSLPQTPASHSPAPPPPQVQVVAPPEEAAVEAIVASPIIEETTEYGFDDSQVFNERSMSTSTSGSTYGEWTGESEVGQGYDYVSGYEGHRSEEPSIEISEPAQDTRYSPQPESTYQQPAPAPPVSSNHSPYHPAPAAASPYAPAPSTDSYPHEDANHYADNSSYSAELATDDPYGAPPTANESWGEHPVEETSYELQGQEPASEGFETQYAGDEQYGQQEQYEGQEQQPATATYSYDPQRDSQPLEPAFSQQPAPNAYQADPYSQPAPNAYQSDPYSQPAASNAYQSNPYAPPQTSWDAPRRTDSPVRTASPYGHAASAPVSPFAPPPPQRQASQPYGAPPPRVYTPDSQSQYAQSSPRGVPMGAVSPLASPPKRSIAAYGSPSRTAAQEYSSSKPPPRRLDSQPYATFNPPPAAPQRADSHDSYATYPQPQPNEQYSAGANGNVTAPASYGGYMAPPTALGGRRSSFDDQPDAYSRPGQVSRQNSSTSANGAPDLGLERCGAPVVSFGFGGRILLVFPNEVRSAYGMDASPYGVDPGAPDAPSTPATVHIRKVTEVGGPIQNATFPGPIFMDGGKANAGKKRKEAVTWLDQRIGELQQETSYLQATQPTAYGMDAAAPQPFNDEKTRKLETRLTLIKLVKALVENEGKLSGTPKIDEAVRAILVPSSVTPADATSDADLPLASELAFSAPPLTPFGAGPDAPFTTYAVTPSNLDKITDFLLRGERRKAVKYALDHKLWAHAFVISSCVDTDCWKDVVAEFLRSELAPPVDGTTTNGREGLRVAYSMFAGLGAESVLQFLPARPLAPPPLLPSQHLAVGAGLIPRAPTPVAADPAMTNLPEGVLSKWQETVALIIANRSVGDSAALTALGDTLRSNGWLDAAHVCYLLSPSTAPIGGLGTGAKFSLVGGEIPTPYTAGGLDLESVMLTELVEFAFSLIPTVKGQDPFVGFPHLQALKLQHASDLADAGLVSQAQKYTDAIGNTIKLATKPSPFYNAGLVAQVKTLSDRLVAAPGHDKAGSWIARKIPKPTVESLWTGLEGRFTKFVAGEGETSAQELAAKAEVAKQAHLNGGPIGPFSHYSSISPGSTSGTLSRTASQTDLVMGISAPPLASPGLGNAGPGLASPFHPPSRPTSAAAALAPPPGPPPVKRAPFKTHHSRSSSLGFAGYNYDPAAPPPWQSYQQGGNARPQDAEATPKPSAQEFQDEPIQPQSGSAYESTGYDPEAGDPEGGGNSSYWGAQPAEGAAPQAPAFLSAGDSFAEDDSGFISPMGAFTPSASPAPTSHYQQPPQQQSHRRTTTREEMDELGLGNSKSRKPAFDSIDEQTGEGEEGAVTPTAEQPPPAGDKPGIKPSKSWLGGWFKREPSPAPGAGPVRANLGEQTSFVFDPELKRWVNKKVRHLDIELSR
ncbi:hypothetical protein RQP46_008970 [Phenoliferia psychrophenolica]